MYRRWSSVVLFLLQSENGRLENKVSSALILQVATECSKQRQVYEFRKKSTIEIMVDDDQNVAYSSGKNKICMWKF